MSERLLSIVPSVRSIMALLLPGCYVIIKEKEFKLAPSFKEDTLC
jgi:hypothetical protein